MMSRRGTTSIRSASSGSMTPMEEEEDTPKRSTRGRNPLPPTTGPLFPPLPPKIPRPKGAKSSPMIPLSPSNSASQPDQSVSSLEKVASPAISSKSSQRKGRKEINQDLEDVGPDIPSGSGTSLTPPPPTSDDVPVEAPKEQNDEPEPSDEADPEDWSAYRRKHGVRGFGKAQIDDDDLDVKMEVDGDEEETPGKSRQGMSDGQGTPTLRSRRRRGEEQLLLDDHLLPEEMRRTGKLTGKRGRDGEELRKGEEDVEMEDNDNAEENEMNKIEDDEELTKEDEEEEKAEIQTTDQEEEEEAQDEDEEDFGDGDEGEGEITRCVCQLENGDDLMVACDSCNVWQHGPCVGIWADLEAPDEYYCERCRPELHGPLKKWIRSKGRNIANFVPPLPEDLQRLHSPHDKFPPTQSRRWKMKPQSRSRDSKDDVKDTKSRRAPSPVAPVRQKSIDQGGKDSKKPISHSRKISIGTLSPPRDARSPTALLSASAMKEPRKRSTMNSRDAAYEDAVQAAIEASRREMHSTEPEEIAEEEGEEEKVDDVEKAERTERRSRGKRKLDEDSVEPASDTGKNKHPNQYTYRPKSHQAAASPSRRGGGTPVPQAPPVQAIHEHGTRRAGALANGAREAPFVAVSTQNLGWNLPEHLSSLSDHLPSSNPVPLSVRSPRQLTQYPKNHFLSALKYGPFTEERQDGKLILPQDPTEREPLGEKGEKHVENPARVKFPQRRITTAEMRKRVKHMLDYCKRLEVEERRRKERCLKIGIPAAAKTEDEEVTKQPEAEDSAPVAETNEEDNVQDNASSRDQPNGHEDSVQGTTSQKSPTPVSTAKGLSAAELLAQLTADLIEFQETWARGGFAPVKDDTPALPSSSNLPNNEKLTNGGLSKDEDEPNGEELEVDGRNGDYEGGLDEGEKLETMDEPVDVYREGKVDVVIATREEDQVAEELEADEAERQEQEKKLIQGESDGS